MRRMGRNRKPKQKAAKKKFAGGRPGKQSLPPVRLEAALAHERAGRMEQAEAAYNRLLQRDPDNAQVLYHLGSLLARSGRQAQALEALEKAAASAPEVAAVHLNLGNLLYLQGRMEEALGAFERARGLAPEMADIHAGIASVHHRLRQPEAAILALERAVALAPARADLVTNLANALHRQERTHAAVAVLRAAVERIPHNDALGHQLAALSGQATPTAPAQFVQETFDRLSSDFDRHLRDDLGYRTPEALRDLLEAATTAPRSFSRMADLGCGTGLSGEAFRSLARHITGIDLSEKMLALAREKEVYHELRCSGIVEALMAPSPPFDLFVAADVLVYMGDLGPLFQAVYRRGTPGAMFLFSTETGAETDWTLKTTGRYAHHSAYVRRLCRTVGFTLWPTARNGFARKKGHGSWAIFSGCNGILPPQRREPPPPPAGEGNTDQRPMRPAFGLRTGQDTVRIHMANILDKRNLMALLAAAAMVLAAAPAALALLQLGDPAPPLAIKAWVQGKPAHRSNGTKTAIHVIEFWAPDCPHCRHSVPLLNDLHRAHGRQVVVTGITGADPEEVRTFLSKAEEPVIYNIAVDEDGRTDKAYMEGFDVSGVPHAFVVDRQGRIAWHGHPMDGLAEALDRMVAGTYDLEKEARLATANKLVGVYIYLAERTRETDLLRQLGERIMAYAGHDARLLRRWAQRMADSSQIRNPDLALALRAVEQAYRLDSGSRKQLAEIRERLLQRRGRKTDGRSEEAGTEAEGETAFTE